MGTTIMPLINLVTDALQDASLALIKSHVEAAIIRNSMSLLRQLLTLAFADRNITLITVSAALVPQDASNVLAIPVAPPVTQSTTILLPMQPGPATAKTGTTTNPPPP